MKLRFSLISKIFLPFGLAIIILMASAHFISIPNLIEDEKQLSLEQEKIKLSLLSTSIAADVMSLDIATVYSTLDQVLEDSRLWNEIYLVDEEGIVLYPLGTEIPEAKSHIDHSIMIENAHIGKLHLFVDFTIVEERIRNRIFNAELYVLLGLLILFSIVSFIQYFGVLRPIKALGKFAFITSEGNYSGKYAYKVNDEIGDVYKAFTFMNVKLAKREAELKEALSAAKEANLAKSRFLAAMSHEIRTPMTGVLGMADLLSDTEMSQQQKSWVSSILHSGKNLLGILNEILDQSKLDADLVEISPIAVDFRSFMNHSLNIFIPSLKSKGIGFTLDISNDVPKRLEFDDMRVGQVISNILSNAIKFTAIGNIAIKAWGTNFKNETLILHFQVTDTGVGISEEAQSTIFDPFTQADNTTSRRFGGTGLGLSISKRLVELMGGDILVHSILGQGTSFEFSIDTKLAQSKPIQITDKSSHNQWRAERPLKILIVDDYEVNRQLISAMCRKLDHNVILAEDGRMSIEVVEKTDDIDVILMDIRMPILDGLGATEIIRSMDDTNKASIPIIALTADVIPENVKHYLAGGFDRVVPKPIDKSEVFNTINDVLDEKIHIPCGADIKDDSSEENELLEIDNVIEIKNAEAARRLIDKSRVMLQDVEISSISIDLLSKSPQFAELDESFVIQMRDEFEIKMKADGEEIERLRQLLLQPSRPDNVAEKIEFITHSLKGMAPTFCYSLLGHAASKLNVFLKEHKSLEQEDVLHILALSEIICLVSEYKIFDSGGEIGGILYDALRQL